MIVLLAWWCIPLVVLVVLIIQARKKSSAIRQQSAAYALGVYLLFTIIGTLHIFSIRSSTAGIGLLFLPLIAIVPAGIAYVLGYLVGQYRAYKSLDASLTQDKVWIGLCALLLVGSFGWQFSEISKTTAKNTERDIKQAKRKTDLKENKQRVRWILADNKGNEADKLIELAGKSTDETMLIAIASNRYASGELLDKLSHKNNYSITLSVIRNNNTTSETLEWVFNNTKNSNSYYSDFARNHKTPKSILRFIFNKRHVNKGIPWSLASNESTPIDLLKKLSDESDENVLKHLSKNKAYAQNK